MEASARQDPSLLKALPKVNYPNILRLSRYLPALPMPRIVLKKWVWTILDGSEQKRQLLLLAKALDVGDEVVLLALAELQVWHSAVLGAHGRAQQLGRHAWARGDRWKCRQAVRRRRS